MQFVTLVNRSNKILHGVWNGRHYDLAPGKHQFPEIQAQKFKEQNPKMGTEDPITGYKDYLIGIEEFNDDCSPIDAGAAITRMDLSKVPGGDQMEVIKAAGLYTPKDASPLPSGNSNFVKP